MKLIVANWKMYKTKKEAEALAGQIIEKLRIKDLEIVFCPSFTALSGVYQIIKSSNNPALHLGAQNCHFMPCGAYTGEISPSQLLDFCEYVILGHSERRKYFNEDDELINKKIKVALKHGLKPIVCVGEWKKGDAAEGIFKQVKVAINGLNEKEFKNLIFAYEPVWAIGTGEQPEPSYANKIIKEIKEIVGKESRVLYGGSVDNENVKGFAGQPGIDGFLVGGASLKAEEFLKIIEEVIGGIKC